MKRFPCWLLPLAAALLTGCGHWAPYHQGLEQRVARMDERTQEMLAIRRSSIPAATSQGYVQDSLFALRWLREDAAEYHEKGPEVAVIERAHAHFLALEARKRPLGRADLLTVAGDIIELHRYQETKRAHSEWRAAHPSTTTSTDSPTTDDTTTSKKDDNKHDHRDGGHDRGDNGKHH